MWLIDYSIVSLLHWQVMLYFSNVKLNFLFCLAIVKFHFWGKDVFNFLPGIAISGSKGIEEIIQGSVWWKTGTINKTDAETLNYCKNGGNKQKVE